MARKNFNGNPSVAQNPTNNAKPGVIGGKAVKSNGGGGRAHDARNAASDGVTLGQYKHTKSNQHYTSSKANREI